MQVAGPARGFGYTVSRAFFTKVFGILCQNFQV